jgi:hypothetical protein
MNRLSIVHYVVPNRLVLFRRNAVWNLMSTDAYVLLVAINSL